jgi:hypothetical protein
MRSIAVRLVVCAAVAGTTFLAVVPARAESELEKILKQYSDETVKGYIQPLADLLGANMHSGFYHSARIATSSPYFSFQIISMASVVTDETKYYDAPTPAGFDPATFRTATVFGGDGALVKHNTIPGLEYRGSSGVFNTSLFFLGVPQITIGGFAGTEVLGRFMYIPELATGKFPQTTLWSAGARHSISQYFPTLPLDIAVGGFYSSIDGGDIIDFKGYALTAHASKTLEVLTLYGGLAYEHGTMKLKYVSTDLSSSPLVDVSMDGAQTFRFTLGAGLTLGPVTLFADANFGSVTAFSAGIGFGG